MFGVSFAFYVFTATAPTKHNKECLFTVLPYKIPYIFTSLCNILATVDEKWRKDCKYYCLKGLWYILN